MNIPATFHLTNLHMYTYGVWREGAGLGGVCLVYTLVCVYVYSYIQTEEKINCKSEKQPRFLHSVHE